MDATWNGHRRQAQYVKLQNLQIDIAIVYLNEKGCSVKMYVHIGEW